MKRSISRWTMSLATAGVLALPVTSYARPAQQTPPQQQPAQPSPAQPQPDRPQPAQPPAQSQPDRPQPQQPQPTEPQPTQQPTTSAAQSTTDQTVSPQEHLRQAQQAVNEISATSVPAKNRSQIAELKRHLSNLEKMGSSPSASTTQPTGGTANKSTNATKNSNNWGTEVAAIDKIITEMAGNDTSAGAPTSTAGATGTSGSTKSSSATIDEATRAKLMDVRTHITAYAAGMAGSSSTPKTEAASSSAAPSAATAAHAEPSMTATSPASSQPAATPESTPSAQSPASSQSSSAAASSQSPSAGSQNPQNPPATQPNPNAAGGAAQQPPAEGQPPSTAGQQPSAAAGEPMNTEEAHKQLVAARDTLSQLTQLPAAAQLNGEARTQVAQLITNFNELIGNPPDWHASYQKVASNLNTLLGPDNTDAEAQGGAPTNATGATAAPGTVGTSGAATVELDPSIRAKLVEFRRTLVQFEKSAGGSK